jgi:hypothetical protein
LIRDLVAAEAREARFRIHDGFEFRAIYYCTRSITPHAARAPPAQPATTPSGQ